MGEALSEICLNCGREHDNSLLWGCADECDCDSPNVVHRVKCDGCDNIIGLTVDDDYAVTVKLYCPQCVIKTGLKHD